MSLPRAAFKPLARLSIVPSRALSSSRAVLQYGNYPNSDYFSRRPDSNGTSDQEARGRPDTDSSQTRASEGSAAEDLAQDTHFRTMSNFMTRLGQWKKGDIYAPHDLTGVEASKWKRRVNASPTTDAFDTLALDPLKEYKNFSIMSNYMSEYGRIKHRKVTGLRPKNQRKLAKAIRRSIGLGIMPSVHAHPESIWNTSHVQIEDLKLR